MDTAPNESRPIPAERRDDQNRGLLATILSAPQWVIELVHTASIRPLVLNDIYRVSPEGQTLNLLVDFKANYATMSGVRYTELFCVFRVLAKDIALVFIVGVHLGSLTIILPFMFRLILLELQEPVGLVSKGRACLITFVCSFLLMMMRMGNTLWMQAGSLMIEKVRSLLVLALYDKALRLSPLEYKTYDEPQITVLIMNDVERFIKPWSTLVTMGGISLLLLPQFCFLLDVLGFASLVYPVAIVLSVALFSGFASAMADSDNAALRAADFRIGLLRELLKNVHIVKFYGWERPMVTMLDAYHHMELKSLMLSRLLSSINATFSDMMSPVCSSMAFMIYVYSNHVLTPDRAFSAIILGVCMFQALAIAPEAYMDTVNAIKSVQRIDSFFQARERTNVLGQLPAKGKYVYDIRDCTIGWPSKVVLRDLKVRVSKGALVVVTGPVGSGKSTMLAALTGLCSQTNGTIRVRKGVKVYSVMKNWAQNGSLRDNILFGREWNPRKYEWVTSLCCLDTDFLALPDGDLTEIGDGGVTLSGGQRTRISLARCIYADPDVYILDDVLASVDGHVARKIFRGLRNIASGQKTVVLASNDYKILHSADKVLFLDGHGRYFYGTYAKLLRNPSFSDAMQSAVSVPGLESDSDESDGGEDLMPSVPPQSLNILSHPPTMPAHGFYEGGFCSDAHFSRKGCKSLNYFFPENASDEQGSTLFSLVDQEDNNAPHYSSNRSYTWCLLQTASEWTCRLLVFASSLFASQATLSIFPPLMVSFVVSADSVTGQQELMHLLSAGVLVRTIFLLSSNIVKNFALDGFVRHIHRAATLNLFQAPMSYFESMPMGRLLARYTVDLGVLNSDFRYLVPASVTFFTTMVAFTALIAWIEPLFGIPFFLYMLTRMVVWWQSTAPISRSHQLRMTNETKVTSSIMEKVNGLSVIADHEQEDNALKNLAEALDDRYMCVSTALYMQRFAIFSALRQVTLWFVMLPIAAIVLDREPRAAMIGLLIYALALISFFSDSYIGIANYRASCSESSNRLAELVSGLPKEIYFRSEADVSSSHIWRANHGAVEFVNTYFQYRRQLPFVLNDFSLKIQAGEKVGICGRTGVGKTTIFNALFRFSELQRGKILIDGQDISNIGVRELRNSLAVIPQQTVLFRGTIRSNLDPMQEMEDLVLWDALRRSGFCDATTKQVHLDYEVEAEGSNFSLGERQLIALARALVRRCRLILLDEATAAVDYATDRLIQQTIQREFSTCTILCIAHRIQTIVNYDKILALGVGGRCIEFGKPKELYNRKGLFWEMCEDAGVEDTDFK